MKGLVPALDSRHGVVIAKYESLPQRVCVVTAMDGNAEPSRSTERSMSSIRCTESADTAPRPQKGSSSVSSLAILRGWGRRASVAMDLSLLAPSGQHFRPAVGAAECDADRE
jgi:hypothetical protein